MKTNLQDKIVFVTGAAQGIGRATALAFAAEGSRLALLDIDVAGLETVKAEAEALGAKAFVTRADLSSGPGIEQAFNTALEHYGQRIDVLINNVGSGAVRLFDDLSDEAWDATMQLNFMSYVRTCRKVLPLMRAQQSGVTVSYTHLTLPTKRIV